MERDFVDFILLQKESSTVNSKVRPFLNYIGEVGELIPPENIFNTK